MQLGTFEVHSVMEGMFRLDGGAMFGSVPKTLWNKLIEADEANRIPLALRCLLIRDGKRIFLVDTGIGEKETGKFVDMFAVSHAQHNMQRSLKLLGLSLSDITDVILTHLHFDHAGGATCKDVTGNLAPTFPNAVYYVPRANYELAVRPNPKDKASYLPENFEPLVAAGKLKILDTPEIYPGISYVLSYGHTTGMGCVKVQSQGQTMFYCADLIPTRHHIPLAYVMGYDLYALTTMEEKLALLEQAVAEDWTLFFEHDPEIPACKVERNKNNFKAGQVVHV